MKRGLVILLSALVALTTAGCRMAGGAGSSVSEPISAVEPESAGEPEEAHLSDAAQELETVNHNWTFDSPENHGVNADMLKALHQAAAQTEIYSIVTAKDGVIIDEYYKEGYDAKSVFRLASCTKSISGALIGIAIDKGYVSGVDTKLTTYFPGLAQSGDAYKQEITLAHLLTHTAGFEWYEWGGGKMFGQFTRSENWVDFVLNRPIAAKPGTTFNYSTGGSHLLAAVLQQATGRTAADFGQEFLFEPLGMDSVRWSHDPQGITDGGNGISMTARDAAKFGQLYLNGGEWQGRQVVPAWWVEESVKVQFQRWDHSGSYGYQWWIRPFGDENYDTFYAMGHGGQFIFVVPELGLVTVITSRFSDTYAPRPYFYDYILAACAPPEKSGQT